MNTEYGRYKRQPTPSQHKRHKSAPRPLTAAQLARAKQAKADWDTHMGNTPVKNLVKDLHAAGLIDGWRDVTVTIEDNRKETA